MSARTCACPRTASTRAELNDGTRQLHDDILKDLDSLINQEKNGGGRRCRPGSAESGQQYQEPETTAAEQGNGQAKVGMSKPKGGLKGSQQQAKAGQKKQGGQGQKPRPAGGQGRREAGQPGRRQQGQKPPQARPAERQPGRRRRQVDGPPNKLAELYKDVWGHLPETMRAEMNAYRASSSWPSTTTLSSSTIAPSPRRPQERLIAIAMVRGTISPLRLPRGSNESEALMWTRRHSCTNALGTLGITGDALAFQGDGRRDARPCPTAATPRHG